MKLRVNIAVAITALLASGAMEASEKIVENGVFYLPVNHTDYIEVVLSPSGVMPDDVDAPAYYILNKDQKLFPTDLEKVAFIRGSDPSVNCVQIIKNDFRVPDFVEADGEFIPVLGLYPGVFGNAKSENVWMPDGIVFIGFDAFSEAKNIKKIELPASLAIIEANTFVDMDALEAVVVRGHGDKIQADPTAFKGSAEHAVLYVDAESGVVDLKEAPWNSFKEVRPLSDFYKSATQGEILTALSDKDCGIIENIEFPADLNHREIKTYDDLKKYRPGVFAPGTPSFFQFWMEDSEVPTYIYPTDTKSFPVSADGVAFESQELFFVDKVSGEETFKYHVCEVYRTEDGKTTTYGADAEIPGLKIKENGLGNLNFEFAANESANSVSWVVCLKSDMEVEHLDSQNISDAVVDFKYILMPFHQLGAGEKFNRYMLTRKCDVPEDSEYMKYLDRLAESK